MALNPTKIGEERQGGRYGDGEKFDLMQRRHLGSKATFKYSPHKRTFWGGGISDRKRRGASRKSREGAGVEKLRRPRGGPRRFVSVRKRWQAS